MKYYKSALLLQTSRQRNLLQRVQRPYGFIPYPVSFVPIIDFYSPVYKGSHVYSPNSGDCSILFPLFITHIHLMNAITTVVNTKGAHPPIHQTLNKIYLQIFPYEKAYEKRKMYE
ncbi:unnamed protein product [Schistosoma rodhaini]|nr:unnamed protein product [Schistosoma rodhaini]